jgi:hypothetical protein
MNVTVYLIANNKMTSIELLVDKSYGFFYQRFKDHHLANDATTGVTV